MLDVPRGPYEPCQDWMVTQLQIATVEAVHSPDWSKSKEEGNLDEHSDADTKEDQKGAEDQSSEEEEGDDDGDNDDDNESVLENQPACSG